MHLMLCKSCSVCIAGVCTYFVLCIMYFLFKRRLHTGVVYGDTLSEGLFTPVEIVKHPRRYLKARGVLWVLACAGAGIWMDCDTDPGDHFFVRCGRGSCA